MSGSVPDARPSPGLGGSTGAAHDRGVSGRQGDLSRPGPEVQQADAGYGHRERGAAYHDQPGELTERPPGRVDEQHDNQNSEHRGTDQTGKVERAALAPAAVASRNTHDSVSNLGQPSVALYLRVSTEDQDLAGQERELRTYAEAHGWTVAVVYAEKVSGTGRVEREEYDRLLRDAARPDRGWDILLVWALDRWSREERFDKAVGSVLDLEKGGLRFVTLKEPYLSTPDPDDANAGFARNLLLGVVTSVAAFESRRKSERVRVAMREIREGRRATRSGRPPGRPRRVTPEKTAKILELRAQGKLKWREIAPRVGLPAGTCAAVYSKSRSQSGGPCAVGESGQSLKVTVRSPEQVARISAGGRGR